MAFGAYITLVPKAQDATLVIAALGYKDAANVSLPLNSELAKLQWTEDHGKPFLENKDDDFVLYY